MTTNDILQRVREIIGDKDKVYWTDEELTKWLDEGVQDYAQRTQLFRKQASLHITPDRVTYKIDDPLLDTILGIYDETLHHPLELSPYSIGKERNAVPNVVLIASAGEIVVPFSHGEAIYTVEYTIVPDSLGDGFIVYDQDGDGVDDQVTHDYDGDTIPDKLYWVENGYPAAKLPAHRLLPLIDYVVFRAYSVDRAEANLQKAQYHNLKYEAAVREAKDWAFGAFSNTFPHIEYVGF